MDDGSIWEWRTESGAFRRDVDTARVRALYNNRLSLANTTEKQPGFDPYNSADRPVRDPDTKPRKSIDNLRKLSEEIKRARRFDEQKKRNKY